MRHLSFHARAHARYRVAVCSDPFSRVMKEENSNDGNRKESIELSGCASKHVFVSLLASQKFKFLAMTACNLTELTTALCAFELCSSCKKVIDN